MSFGMPSMLQKPIALHEVSLDTKVVAGVASANTALLASELDVNMSAPATGSHTLTLPAAVLCAGKFFNLYITGTLGSGDIILASNAGDLIAVSIGDNFTAAGDYCSMYCNGRFWVLIAEVST